MWNRITSRVSRPVWVTLVIVAVLLASLAFEPVRAVANSFLGLFRVEQIRVVQVDPGDLPDQLGSSSQLEQILSRDVQVQERGEPQEVANVAEASQLTGIPVRLPSEIEGQMKIIVQPGGRLTFNVDLELVQAVLKDIGRSDIYLPKDLDGAAVTLEIPTSVAALLGDCDFVEEAQEVPDPDVPAPIHSDNCTTLMQMPSPTISAPPGLDMTGIGEAYLQILGMTQDEAKRFARNVDWTTTFVIPLPRYSADHQDISVDGVKGILIQTKYRNRYVLLWVKDGILYTLSGPGDEETALEIAASLK